MSILFRCTTAFIVFIFFAIGIPLDSVGDEGEEDRVVVEPVDFLFDGGSLVFEISSDKLQQSIFLFVFHPKPSQQKDGVEIQKFAIAKDERMKDARHFMQKDAFALKLSRLVGGDRVSSGTLNNAIHQLLRGERRVAHWGDKAMSLLKEPGSLGMVFVEQDRSKGTGVINGKF